jgi:hypothetical protein
VVVIHDIRPTGRSFLIHCTQLERPTSPLAKWPWTRTRLSVHTPAAPGLLTLRRGALACRSVSASVPTPDLVRGTTGFKSVPVRAQTFSFTAFPSLLCQVNRLAATPGRPCAREFWLQTTTLHHLPSGVYIADQRRDVTNHLAVNGKSTLPQDCTKPVRVRQPYVCKASEPRQPPRWEKNSCRHTAPPQRWKASGWNKDIHTLIPDKMMAASVSLRNPKGPESTSEDAVAKQSTVAM